MLPISPHKILPAYKILIVWQDVRGKHYDHLEILQFSDIFTESRRTSINKFLKAAGYLDCAIQHVLPQLPPDLRLRSSKYFSHILEINFVNLLHVTVIYARSLVKMFPFEIDML